MPVSMIAGRLELQRVAAIALAISETRVRLNGELERRIEQRALHSWGARHPLADLVGAPGEI